MFGLSKKEIAKRNYFLYQLAKWISNLGYRFLSSVHIEAPSQTFRDLKAGNAVFLYTGLHRSLWETTGMLSSAYMQKLPIPYAGMGDNLVKGAFFQKLGGKVGAFLVKRAKTRREMVESSKKLGAIISYYMATGIDVSIYPEGTRRGIPETGKYGVFFPTVFDALLKYEKNKDQILEEYPELEAKETYIVPFNVDYSKVREDHELVKDKIAKPRTLHIFDSLRMITHIGDVYISYGAPIKTTDVLDKSRKELAVLCHQKCLDLIKILPINLVSRAMVDSEENGTINHDKILDNIAANIKKAAHLKDRFRGFSIDDEPAELLAKLAKRHPEFRQPDASLIPFYSLYADYIGHYFPEKMETGQ